MSNSQGVGTIQHIAFIPDGNRRWAKSRGLPSVAGHKFGYDKIKEVVLLLPKYGIKYVSFFGFSTENWNRPKEEVTYLMKLFFTVCDDLDGFLMKNHIRVKIIGDREKLSNDLNDKIATLEDKTKNNDAITIIGAISYSGRDEIVRTTKKIAEDIADKKITVSDINESSFSSYMDCPDIPAPDIMVRTSERRISNFMLWQLAYSELLFVDKFWPDFDETDLQKIIDDFANRQRRYGK